MSEEVAELVFRSKEERAKTTNEDEPVGEEFKFRLPDDDHVYVATRPKKTILAEALASITARRNNTGDALTGMRDFLENTLDYASWAALHDHLMDPDDDFDDQDMAEVFNHLVKVMWKPTGKKRGR